jgi:hypothetical protein
VTSASGVLAFFPFLCHILMTDTNVPVQAILVLKSVFFVAGFPGHIMRKAMRNYF